MARRSLAWNGAADRVEVRDGDFRDSALLAGQGLFDLVTGTPPYFPIGTGPQSEATQRAPCRFEHHGGVEAYCEAAARVLAPGAPLVACEAWIQRERVEPAGRAAGLALHYWREVIPRAGKDPLFVVFAMTAAAILAKQAGLDPEVCTIYRQSDVPEVIELMSFFSMVTRIRSPSRS